MALDHMQLERPLCERLCADVRVHRRHDDVLMLESPFTFTDEKGHPIYLSETLGGNLNLTYRHHAILNLIYERDGEILYEVPLGILREKIVSECGTHEEEDMITIETLPN